MTHQAEDFLVSVVTILPVHDFPFKSLVSKKILLQVTFLISHFKIRRELRKRSMKLKASVSFLWKWSNILSMQKEDWFLQQKVWWRCGVTSVLFFKVSSNYPWYMMIGKSTCSLGCWYSTSPWKENIHWRFWAKPGFTKKDDFVKDKMKPKNSGGRLKFVWQILKKIPTPWFFRPKMPLWSKT